jgi:hypothetical protein
VDGAFLLWNKTDLEQVTRATSSMHGDLGQHLSAEQIRDLVSYLVRAGGPPQKRKDYDSDE